MKICKCLCVCMLSAIMLFSLMVPASAAGNYTDRKFVDFDIWVDGRKLDAEEKWDTTPHYLYVTGGNIDTMSIQSYGNTYDTTSGGVNCTYSNGKLVNYVTCRKGDPYLVRNLVKENRYSWATLGIARKNSPAGGWVTGVWSPDSIGSYTVAQP